MKLLIIGDFHGAFPKKFEKLINKEKIDLVISNGDFLPFAYRKLWFKHCFDKDICLWQVIGKSKYRKLINKDMNMGEYVLKKMNRLPVPVVTVLGNVDWPDPNDVADPQQIKGNMPGRSWKFEKDRNNYFAKLVKKYKNIHLINYSTKKIKGYYFIGMRGHSFPGREKNKAFKKHRKILDSLFLKLNRENRKRKAIFISHNIPYNTKLDKIGMKAHALVRGKHFGSKLARKIIDKWQPFLAVGGHIHEGRGMQKVGKTICINPGSFHTGQYAIAELDDQKGKIKVTFKVKK